LARVTKGCNILSAPGCQVCHRNDGVLASYLAEKAANPAASKTVNRFSKFVRSMRVFRQELARVSSAPGPKSRPRIGLALGGGFARGLAHIGVLKVFEQEKIRIDFIAGTSVGAVIGAGYCSGLTPRELEEVAMQVRFKDFARWTLSRYSFASHDRMEGFLRRVVKVRTFEELRIPLAVTATDLQTGEGVVFRSGALNDPVRASCAYPGMFPPVNVNGRLLVDGLLAHAVPTRPLREMGAERVVGVYLNAHWVNGNGPRHIFDIIGQCFSIAQANMGNVWKSAADVMVEPNVSNCSYDGFDRAKQLICAGEEATLAVLPKIREWLAGWQPEAEAPKTEEKPKKIVSSPGPLPAEIG
jgi:NTE family protein